MHANQIYYRFKSETKEEVMTFEESEITAGTLRQRIIEKKFSIFYINSKKLYKGGAPEKFELILKDHNTKRDFLDNEIIKPKTTVLVVRLPGQMPRADGVYIQPTEEILENKKKIDSDGKILGDNEKSKKSPEEEYSDSLLAKYDIGPGHRLYPFLKNAKFYIIKSSNTTNIDISKKNEEWATTTFNQDKVDKAFQSCQNVILFFSVNKSQEFQGMAKMVSGVTGRISREWETPGVKLGGCFKVKWLVSSKMSFKRIENFRNPITNDPIRKARDTTEIPPEMGVQIALHIDECRDGQIDLPTLMRSNPNFDMNKLCLAEPAQIISKQQKPEEKQDTFDLFDDLALNKTSNTNGLSNLDQSFAEPLSDQNKSMPTEPQKVADLLKQDPNLIQQPDKRSKSTNRDKSETKTVSQVIGQTPPVIPPVARPQPTAWDQFGMGGVPPVMGPGMPPGMTLVYDQWGRPIYVPAGTIPGDNRDSSRHRSSHHHSSHKHRSKSRSRSRHHSKDKSKSKHHESSHKSHHSKKDHRYLF